MKDKTDSNSDFSLFREAFSDVKPLKQDKVRLTPDKISKLAQFDVQSNRTKFEKKLNASFQFSDEYEPDFSKEGPLSWVKSGENTYLAKQLRRGDFQPDILLDLHGLNRDQAKYELVGLIEHCQKHHIECACISHGIGARILKRKLPHWLVQHPAVIAFHQAPLEWGGDGSVLVCFSLPDAQKWDK